MVRATQYRRLSRDECDRIPPSAHSRLFLRGDLRHSREDRERTAEEAAALGDGQSTVQFQNRYFDREGKVHWLEWASVPLADEHVIYAVARDVSERKAMEEELERLSRHDSLTGLLAERLVSVFSATPLTIDGREVPLSISVGVALFDAYGCPPAKDLLSAADRAMYVVKAAGGNGAVLAGSPA